MYTKLSISTSPSLFVQKPLNVPLVTQVVSRDEDHTYTVRVRCGTLPGGRVKRSGVVEEDLRKVIVTLLLHGSEVSQGHQAYNILGF